MQVSCKLIKTLKNCMIKRKIPLLKGGPIESSFASMAFAAS